MVLDLYLYLAPLVNGYLDPAAPIAILRLTTEHATVGPKLDAITDCLGVSNAHQSSKRSSHDLAGEAAMCDWQTLATPKIADHLIACRRAVSYARNYMGQSCRQQNSHKVVIKCLFL